MSMQYGPQRATLFLTTHCNLKCDYCYVRSDSELPLDFWKECLGQLCQLKCYHVILTGGEPLIRRDFCEILESVVLNRMRFSVVSNGTLIRNELLQKIDPFKKRCDYFQVSVDGPERIHDSVRGIGSFRSMRKGIDALQEAGYPVQAKITIGTHNASFLPEAAETVFDDLQIPFCSLNYVQDFPGHHTDRRLQLARFGNVMKDLEMLLKRYPGRFLAEGPWMVWQEWRKNEPCSCRKSEVCPAGRESICITANGMVLRCITLDEAPLGNLQEQSLQDILQRSNGCGVIPEEQCLSCTLSCRGRCSATGSLCLKEYLDAGGTL